VALLNRSHVRTLALAALGLGKAYITLNEIDQAAKVIGEVGSLAACNRSARLVKELRTARAALRPWQHTPAVNQLDDQLATCGLSLE
jgi:hypothetical protein